MVFQLLIKFQLLDEPLDLNELMHYPLSPVSHSLGTPDGFFARTNKGSLLHCLNESTDEVLTPRMPPIFKMAMPSSIHFQICLLHASVCRCWTG